MKGTRLKHNRQDRLLRALDAVRVCSISDLAHQLGVSEETVRRDVKVLESAGKVHKLHGAVRLPDNVFETPFDMRISERAAAKAAIAQATAPLIPDHASLFIDSGSTSLHVARALRGHRQLSIITNAMDVARELCSINNNRVFFAGGEIDHDYRASFGVEARDFVGSFIPDIAILSIGAVDPVHGLMDFHLGEAAIKRKVVEISRKVFLVADSDKFGRNGLVQTCPCAAVTTLITDQPVPSEFTGAFADADVVVAAPR